MVANICIVDVNASPLYFQTFGERREALDRIAECLRDRRQGRSLNTARIAMIFMNADGEFAQWTEEEFVLQYSFDTGLNAYEV